MDLLIVAAGAFTQGGIRQFIAGQLLDDEFVVRFVFIKRPNDIVAVPPVVRAFVIVGVSACVGIADDVQPMLSPTLTVLRTRQ